MMRSGFFLSPFQRTLRSFFWMTFAMVLLTSCKDDAIFDQFVTLPEKGWHEDSVMTFSVEITDTVSRYEIFLTIRNTEDYPFSNLFLFREIETRNELQFRDTAQYLLADRFGKWLGKGLGALRTNTFIYKNQALRFTHMGVYTFTLQHGMREEWLPGITDVGLRLVPAKDPPPNKK
jgi:gliding motility-associated lipoprotein GldH